MVKVNGPSADRAAHRPMVSIRRTQVKERRSDGRQFCCTRTAGAICVRIVRNGPSIGFQGLGADGCGGIGLVIVRGTVHRPAAGKPLDRNDIISKLDVADGADGRAPTFSGATAADGRHLRHTFARNPEMQRLRPDKAIALPARTRPPVLGWRLSCTNTATLSEKIR